LNGKVVAGLAAWVRNEREVKGRARALKRKSHRMTTPLRRNFTDNQNSTCSLADLTQDIANNYHSAVRLLQITLLAWLEQPLTMVAGTRRRAFLPLAYKVIKEMSSPGKVPQPIIGEGSGTGTSRMFAKPL
jgi:hypothetical protein